MGRKPPKWRLPPNKALSESVPASCKKGYLLRLCVVYFSMNITNFTTLGCVLGHASADRTADRGFCFCYPPFYGDKCENTCASSLDLKP